MNKTFCDSCGREMPRAGERYVHIELMLSNGTTKRVQLKVNGGPGYEYCHYCFVDAVKKLDDRESSLHWNEEKSVWDRTMVQPSKEGKP